MNHYLLTVFFICTKCKIYHPRLTTHSDTSMFTGLCLTTLCMGLFFIWWQHPKYYGAVR